MENSSCALCWQSAEGCKGCTCCKATPARSDQQRPHPEAEGGDRRRLLLDQEEEEEEQSRPPRRREKSPTCDDMCRGGDCDCASASVAEDDYSEADDDSGDDASSSGGDGLAADLSEVTITPVSNGAAASHCREGHACSVPVTHALNWQANQVAQYLLLAPKAAGNLAAIGYCLARSCVSGLMPWNLSRTWRTLRELASVETTRSYENPQPLRETLREVGLGLEEHFVRTADGYHLTVHRITDPSLSGPQQRPRPVAFLQHGLKCSSADFVVGSGIALEFVRRGHDVWLGNFRGNVHSRGHDDLSPRDQRFWHFSWQEHGSYDLPAMIDYVLCHTGCENLRYVAHSMGTTALFVMLHNEPYRNSQLSRVTALAPVTGITHPTGIIAHFLPTALGIIQFCNGALGNYSFVSPKWLPGYGLGAILVLHYTGWHQIQPEEIRRVMWYSPESTSNGTILHYINCWLAGKFQSRCGGVQYDLGHVRAPVDVFWAPKDWAAGQKDIDSIVGQLENSAGVTVTRVESKDFGHLDFLWSPEMRAHFADLVGGGGGGEATDPPE